HRDQTYRVKCSVMDLRYRDQSFSVDDDEDSRDVDIGVPPSSVNIQTADSEQKTLPRHWIECVQVMSKSQQSAVFTEQSQNGHTYFNGDFMEFKAQTFEPEFMGYSLDFFIESTNGTVTPKHIGYAYILPVNLSQTEGSKTVAINGMKHKPIGQVTVEYLIIKPMRTHTCDMSVSYQSHWKHHRRPLDIGHRGMGNSHDAEFLAAMRENTVGSLTAAGSHGADMVEFDVQLTKDLVPVLYHDFNVCLTMRKKKKEDLQLFQVPVKDLTNAQLQSLKLDHVSMQKYSNIDLTTEESNPPEEQPSPELTRLFESLDPLLGFCIELKYPQRYMNGTHEMDHYFDPNLYLDIILEQILKLAGERRIILCCFHPDICAMASIKQNKYPVFFLTCGVNSLWDTYVDIRTHSFPIAVNFAKADGILGISAHAEELLNDQSLIDIAKAEKKVVISWGEQLNNRETLDKLKDKGIDGLIYDRIYDLKTDKSNVFKLEYEAKLKLLQDLGQIPNTKHAQRQLLGSTSSEPGDNKEDTSSSAESSRSSSPTDKKRPLVVSSDTTLTKAKLPRQMSCI
ncbi:unnamed protein product, partial [Owenia fusiformis]